MKNITSLLIFFTFTAALSKEKETVYVTILIHGTTRPYVNLQNFRSIANSEEVENSPYATINNFVREKCLFSKTQPLQALGLQKIDLKKRFKGDASGAFATAMDHMNKKLNPNQKNIYFTFGWSGLLSTKARIKSAHKLCRALRKINREAKIKNKKVFIRLIAYSHGGTVALNLAKIRRAKKVKIDELIMFGMPVQKDTDYLINSEIFKKIYHFYSPSDRIQGLDLISSEYFFCHKTFIPRKDFKLPKKLTQVKVHVTHNQITDCLCNFKKCPHKKIVYKQFNRNPGHSELWNFGWASRGYRKNFPMHPFPVAVFAPLYIDAINEHNSQFKHLIIDVKPKQDKLVIMDNGGRSKTVKLKTFLPIEELECLKNELYECYKPDEDLEKERLAIFKEAIEYANRKHNPCGSGENMCECK